jgi:SAM-dependent methyltransferase
MKIHLGAGTVYLSGYINIDANPCFLSSNIEAKETLEQNKTIFDNYYKTQFDNRPSLVVADVKALVDNLPFENESVSEIVMFHVLEHVPYYSQDKTLKEISRVLKIGGKFMVAVPDTIGTAKLLVESKTEEEEDWAIRLLYGTQRNEFSHHFIGFTERTLKNLLSLHGFGEFADRENLNFYPAIHVTATKIRS